MTIIVHCKCGKLVQLSNDKLGQHSQCPYCRADLVAPPVSVAEKRILSRPAVPQLSKLDQGSRVHDVAPAPKDPTVTPRPGPPPSTRGVLGAKPVRALDTPAMSDTGTEAIRFPCPFCGEVILATAIKCCHCHEFLYDRLLHHSAATVPALTHQWYLRAENGQTYGPVSREQLDAWFAEKRITAQCCLWQDTNKKILNAADVYPQLAADNQEVVAAEIVADTDAKSAPATPSQKQTRACPFCCELILLAAVKCKHCGEFLDGKNRQSAGTPSPQPPQFTKVKYNPSNDTFTGNMTLLVKLAMRAVQELGWKLDNANENLGIVTFETGISWGSWSGVACSLNIEEVSANQFRVTGTGKQNLRGGQLIAINLGGEATGKAQKAIAKMKDLAR